LELIDKDGHAEYRVADNVSMSYNLLGAEIDFLFKWQPYMVWNIWREAKVFYHSLDANEYIRKMVEKNYYEYGSAHYTINMGWDEIVRLKEEYKCLTCDGAGWTEGSDRHPHEIVNCKKCNGSGLKS
jgi:hypothetical protein